MALEDSLQAQTQSAGMASQMDQSTLQTLSGPEQTMRNDPANYQTGIPDQTQQDGGAGIGAGAPRTTQTQGMNKPVQSYDWNNSAKDYDVISPFTMLFAHDCIEALQIPTELPRDTFVLDIAAGTGSFGLMVAQKICATGEGRILASDISPAMIELLKKKAATELTPMKQLIFDVRVMDAQNLEIKTELISYIGCVFGLMYFPDRVKALSEMYRVLKPGGIAALAVWKCNSFTTALEQMALEQGKVDASSLPLPSTRATLVYADDTSLKNDLMTAGFREGDINLCVTQHAQLASIEAMINFALTNPMAVSMGLSEEGVTQYFRRHECASHPGNIIIEGSAYMVVARKQMMLSQHG